MNLITQTFATVIEMRDAIQRMIASPWDLLLVLEFWIETLDVGQQSGAKTAPRIGLQWRNFGATAQAPCFVELQCRNPADMPLLDAIPSIHSESINRLNAFVNAHYGPINKLAFMSASELADPWHQPTVELLESRILAADHLVNQHITNHTLGPVVARALQMTPKSN